MDWERRKALSVWRINFQLTVQCPDCHAEKVRYNSAKGRFECWGCDKEFTVAEVRAIAQHWSLYGHKDYNDNELCPTNTEIPEEPVVDDDLKTVPPEVWDDAKKKILSIIKNGDKNDDDANE